jgi:hypothetical protein
MHKPWLVGIHKFASLKDTLAAGCARFADLTNIGKILRRERRGDDAATVTPAPTHAASR